MVMNTTTDQDMRDTIRQMLADWNAATPAQRAASLATAKRLADKTEYNAGERQAERRASDQ